MGLPSCQHDYTRYRDGQNCGHDRRETPPHLCKRGRRWRYATGLITGCLLLLSAQFLSAETLRTATYNTELSRKGPGLLLRDIASGKDPQVIAVLNVIKHAQPDVIALQGFDYDLTNLALRLFADQAGYPPHLCGTAQYGHGDGVRPERRWTSWRAK